MISVSANRTNAGIATRNTALYAELAALKKALQFTRDALEKAAASNAKIAKESEEKTEIILDLKDEIENLEAALNKRQNLGGEPLVSPRTVMAQIASSHGMSVDVLTGKSQSKPIVCARHHAMYEVVRRCPHMSWPEIGRTFGKDHTTVMSAVRAWPGKAKSLGIEVLPLGRESLS